MNGFKQAAPNEPMPLGLWIICLVLIGSLWACIGFISEWAGIEAGLSVDLAHRLFRAIGYGTTGLTLGGTLYALFKLPSFRRQAAVGISLYCLLLLLIPRSFTFDTGLYHLPLINHLSQIGLEWNLGFLHSRYAFFNLLLYGQSGLSRLVGTTELPSLNGVVLTGTILFIAELQKNNHQALVPAVVTTGALLLPSEATESFHSFNADFSLGCIFLIACLLIQGDSLAVGNNSLAVATLSIFLPFVKLSGLFLLPVLIAGYLRKWRPGLLIKNMIILMPLISLIVLSSCGFGFITSGYLSYPLATTGPLRDDAINKTLTISESKLSTLAWARFAYSNQKNSMKTDASLEEWLPKWSQSLNGKKMLSFSIASLLTSFAFIRRRRIDELGVMILANTALWLVSIISLPPDPRFYLGPTLLTLYGVSVACSPDWLYLHTSRLKNTKTFFASVICIVLFTSLWRRSEYKDFTYPSPTRVSITTRIRGYTSRSLEPIIYPINGTCWNLRPPCSPQSTVNP